MGASGAVIMAFGGAVFAAMTLSMTLAWSGIALGAPFVVAVAIALAGWVVTRRPGSGVGANARAERVILWSSAVEGIALFVAANLVINLGHREWLLPAIALIVGLHFVPMALAIPFRPFLVLAGALVAIAVVGFMWTSPVAPEVAGFGAAVALWIAALMALRRDAVARRVPSMD